MSSIDKKYVIDSMENNLDRINRIEKYDDDKKIRINAIIRDEIEFLKWLPIQDIFMDYLIKRWNGLSDYAIAREYGLSSRKSVRADKLKKIIRHRCSELRKEYIRQHYDF